MSNFNLDDFKATIAANGVSRPSRYEILLYPPGGVADFNHRDIAVRCATGAIPPFVVDTRDYLVGSGQLRKAAWNFNHGHTLKYAFYGDSKGSVYNGLRDWLNFVKVDPDTPNDHRVKFYEDYIGRVEVHQLNDAGTSIFSCILQEAYPIRLEHIDLSSSSQNEVQLITVEFAYRYATQNEVERSESEWHYRTSTGDASFNRANTPTVEYIDPSFTRVIPVLTPPVDSPAAKYDAAQKSLQSVTSAGYLLRRSQQQDWSTSRAALDSAVMSGNKQQIAAAWDSMQKTYANVNQSATEYMAANKGFQEKFSKVTDLSPSDPLYLAQKAHTVTYSDITKRQTAIQTDFEQITKFMSSTYGSVTVESTTTP